MGARPFRTDESLESERRRRGTIVPLLESHGFIVTQDVRESRGTATTQIIAASHSQTGSIRMRVRLCWRRGNEGESSNLYSAAQLLAGLKNNNWEETLAYIVSREQSLGISHNLLIQFDDETPRLAALIPSSELAAIWSKQRDVSADLIRHNVTFRKSKNHVENGSSPTIWLQDDRRPEAHHVADVLWTWPKVINVLALSQEEDSSLSYDSIDDLFRNGDLGRDGAERSEKQTKSGYPRDQKVRRKVIARAAGKCERSGCSERRNYSGFLDVHHILGVGISDRVWSCVALCPNCHRDAHFAAERDAINKELETFASQFR